MVLQVSPTFPSASTMCIEYGTQFGKQFVLFDVKSMVPRIPIKKKKSTNVYIQNVSFVVILVTTRASVT